MKSLLTGWPLSDHGRILEVMGQTALIPAWVAPAARQVADCHWIAHAAGQTQVCAVLDWVTSDLPDEMDALNRLYATDGAAQVTLAWLLGMATLPPVQLPRRNPDGSVVTADQLYREYMDGKTGLPEQHNEARARASRDAARHQRLASLVPH